MRTRVIPLLALPLILAACGGGSADADAANNNAAQASGEEPGGGDVDAAPAQEPAPPTPAENAAAAAREAAVAPHGWEMCNPQPPPQVIMRGPDGTAVYSAPTMCPRRTPQFPVAVPTVEPPRAMPLPAIQPLANGSDDSSGQR